jgi:hypothetical protein
VGRIVIEKRADGSDYLAAKERAKAIDYSYIYDGSTLGLNAYFTTPIENNYRDQEVELIVYLPIGTILYANDNTYSFHRNDYHYRDILDNGDEEHYLLIQDGETRCLDCPEGENEDWEEDWEKDLNDDEEAKNDTIEGDSIDVNTEETIINTTNIEDTLTIETEN